MKAKEIDYSKNPIYTRAVDDTRHKILNDLEDLLKIQCSNGNWNYDPYMMGLANGMILVKSLITKEEPKYFNAPKRWLKDYPTFWTRLKWKLFPKSMYAVAEKK